MYSLILLNGGTGSRFGAEKPKQLLKLNGIPILIYSLLAVDKITEIDEIVLNYPNGWKNEIESIIKDYAIKKKIILVNAGGSRHQSVKTMLNQTNNKKIIIHESARPVINGEDFVKLININKNNVSYSIPIPFTVAPVDTALKKITGSLERNLLRNIQLPQKFNKEDLVKAHSWADKNKKEFTEDSTLLVCSGHTVFYAEGKNENIKVTTPLDLLIIESLINQDYSNE